MNRLAIARALSETADLLALTGHEPFRARAYERGARVLERLSDQEFDRLVAEGRLTTLAGIGQGLAAVIDDLAGAGRRHSRRSGERCQQARASSAVSRTSASERSRRSTPPWVSRPWSPCGPPARPGGCER